MFYLRFVTIVGLSANPQVDLFDKPKIQSEYNERVLQTIDNVAEKFGRGMLQVGASLKTVK